MYASVGVGQPNCNGTSLKELFIPLPPISEQLRIVPTAQALLAYVAKIDAEKKSLLSIIMATKSKILDLAIRGQLIPQDPNDEPASVLLERIRAEKEELIKQGIVPLPPLSEQRRIVEAIGAMLFELNQIEKSLS